MKFDNSEIIYELNIVHFMKYGFGYSSENDALSLIQGLFR